MLKEGITMIYGTLEVAIKYSDIGKIDEWLQLFLRNDGKNVALADGLLKEPRFYLPVKEIPMHILDDIKSGAPEYLTKANDIEYFYYVVQKMIESKTEWNPPPLIIEFCDDQSFYVCDGRHRLEMYRQLGEEFVPAIVWTTGKNNYEKLRRILK